MIRRSPADRNQPQQKTPSNNIQSNNYAAHIYYQNVRGLRTKSKLFFLSTLACDYDVIALTETWFNDTHSSSEWFNGAYIVHRSDRNTNNSGKGGGVVIATKRTIHSERLMENEYLDLDFVCLKCHFKSQIFIFYCLYLQPDSSIDLYQRHINAIEDLMRVWTDKVFIIGDFNLPNIDWFSNDNNDYLPANVSSGQAILTLDSLLGLGLSQMIDITNDCGNVLDLVFTSDPSLVSFRIASPNEYLSKLDTKHYPFHLFIECIEFNDCEEDKTEITYAFHKANFRSLSEFIENHEIIRNLNDLDSVDVLIDGLYAVIYESFEYFVPHRAIRNRNHPPWFNRNLLKLKNRRNKLHKRIKSNVSILGRISTNDIQIEYDLVKKEFEILQNFLYQNYLLYIESNLKKNPKQFWNYVSLKKENNSLPSKMLFNGNHASSDVDKAELFASFFKSVFVNDANEVPIDEFLIGYYPTSRFTTISIEEIHNELLSIDTNKGIGPDRIHPILLKNCANALARPLQLIFNKSMEDCIFPRRWKSSHVTPIFKSGSKSSVTNYRSIVKMPTIGKFFESIVNKRIKESIAHKITPRQHGFVTSRSTTSNVIEFVEYSLRNIENGNQIDVLYTDFLKAFDRVDHRILISKMKQFDLPVKVIRWIWSYLRGRKLCVRVNQQLSSSFVTNSGVPQGSHLGPTLFTMFINDLPQIVNSVNILLYADDAKSYAIVNNASDAAQFQQGIEQLNNWCSENKLQLNVLKCKIMSFHRKRVPFVGNYRIANDNIARVDKFRDLGILLDPKLSFTLHIDTIIAKAFSCLGFLKRMCSNMYDPYTLKSLYCAHVRSVLEYASVIWQPHYPVHIKRIENIQHKFTRFAIRYLDWDYENNPRPSYETRCKMIDIETLERRRFNANYFIFYDILNGFIDAPRLSEEIVFNEPARSLRNNGNDRIRIEFRRTNYGKNAPMNRMSRLYNAIDDDIRLGNSRSKFRSQIKSMQVIPNVNLYVD